MAEQETIPEKLREQIEQFVINSHYNKRHKNIFIMPYTIKIVGKNICLKPECVDHDILREYENKEWEKKLDEIGKKYGYHVFLDADCYEIPDECDSEEY